MNSQLVTLARKCLDGKTPHEAVNAFVRELTNRSNAHLMHALALFGLQQVATKGVGQQRRVTHSKVADAGIGHRDDDTHEMAADAPGASGHTASETHGGHAGGATSSKPKSKWKAPPSPTPEQRAGAAEIAKLVTKSVFDTYRIGHQPIGNLKWRELSAVITESATQAANKLDGGFKQTVDAFLGRRVRDYARPPTDDTMVRNMVPEPKLTEMIRESEAEARQVIAYGVKHQRAIIENPWDVITNQTPTT